MVIEKIRKDDLVNMEIGESKDFDISDHINVRSMSSQYGTAWRKRFKTKTDRSKDIITVTRTK